MSTSIGRIQFFSLRAHSVIFPAGCRFLYCWVFPIAIVTLSEYIFDNGITQPLISVVGAICSASMVFDKTVWKTKPMVKLSLLIAILMMTGNLICHCPDTFRRMAINVIGGVSLAYARLFNNQPPDS